MAKSIGYVFKGRNYIGSAEPPATVLEDESRFGNDGTFKASGEPNWVQLPSGLWVMDFDGTDDLVTIPNHASLTVGAGDWTIKMWIKHPANTERKGLIGTFDGATTTGWYFDILNTGYLRNTYHKTPSIYAYKDSDTVVDDDVWHHIAAIWVSDAVLIYIDGIDVTTGGASGGTADNIPSPEDLRIGYSESAVAEGQPYAEGYITPPSLNNYGLSAGKVKQIFEAEVHWFR